MWTGANRGEWGEEASQCWGAMEGVPLAINEYSRGIHRLFIWVVLIQTHRCRTMERAHALLQVQPSARGAQQRIPLLKPRA